MAKFTREQLEKMLADLDEEEHEEVWIKEGEREYKVTGKRATGLLDQLLGDGGEDEDDAGTATGEPEPEKTSVKYFGSRKTAS